MYKDANDHTDKTSKVNLQSSVEQTVDLESTMPHTKIQN